MPPGTTPRPSSAVVKPAATPAPSSAKVKPPAKPASSSTVVEPPARKKVCLREREARGALPLPPPPPPPPPYYDEDEVDYAADTEDSDVELDPELPNQEEETESDKDDPAAASADTASASADIHGGGGRLTVRCGKREVVAPHEQRNDVGTYGIYVGNWGGKLQRTNEWMGNHIARDVIACNPAGVLMASQVDHDFICSLRTPWMCPRACPEPVPMARWEERETDPREWHVATTEDTREENPGAHTLIVAARGSLAKSSTVVEKKIVEHRVCKKHNGKWPRRARGSWSRRWSGGHRWPASPRFGCSMCTSTTLSRSR